MDTAPITSSITSRTRIIFQGSRKRQAVILAAIAVPIILLAAALLFFLFKPAAKESQLQPVLTVAVENPVMHEFQRQIMLTGTVWAWDPLTIGAEIGGLKIENIYVDEGYRVKKGQVLATLNSSLIRAALAKERARLQASQAQLVKTIQPNRPEEISSIRSQVAQMKSGIAQEEANVIRAKANLANAKRNAERFSTLAGQGAISQKDADDKKTEESMVEAELRAAQHRLEAAKSTFAQAQEKWNIAVVGGRKEDVDIAKASLMEAQATVSQLEAQLAQTIIRAPSDGIITKREAHIGDISVPSETLFHMIRDARLEVRAQVPEGDLVRLFPGEAVQFSHPGLTAPLTGKIREIMPIVDPDTRLATVRIDVPYTSTLLPGMFVKGQVTLANEPALAVPAQAVINRDDRSCVFVVQTDSKGNVRVVSRTVKLGDTFGGMIEIKAGLLPSEKVVTVGGGFLKDGDVVKVAQEQK